MKEHLVIMCMLIGKLTNFPDAATSEKYFFSDDDITKTHLFVHL